MKLFAEFDGSVYETPSDQNGPDANGCYDIRVGGGDRKGLGIRGAGIRQ